MHWFIGIFMENLHILYESAVIFKDDGGVLRKSCSENYRNLQKKICHEVLFGKSDISRAVLKMEISRIGNPNETYKELVLL